MRGQAAILRMVWTRNLAVWVLLGIACLSLVHAVYGALSVTRGDFFATLPGHFAERFNLSLWDSADLRGSWGYHDHGYLYGPVQYLTLFPIVFLNSYRQIASVLLALYTGLILILVYLIWRVSRSVAHRESRWLFALLAFSALIFLPLLQALTQREFEVVQFLAIVVAAYLLIEKRELVASAILGYITWFKIWPLAFVGYFVLRRRWKAVGVFVVTSALVLLTAHLVFDLTYFDYSLAELPIEFGPRIFATGEDFCIEWTAGDRTVASLRAGLCAVAEKLPWVSARGAFVVITLAAGIVFLASFIALERRGRAERPEESFRTLMELSLVLLAASLSVHAHYYYLIGLLLPISVLLARYLGQRADVVWPKLGLLAIAYVVLSGFVVPVSALSRALGRDMWAIYTNNALYLYGEIALGGLILWEYANLGFRPIRCERSTSS